LAGLGNPNLPQDQRSATQWFNLAAFAEPLPITAAQCASGACPAVTYGTVGNTPQNLIRGPGRNNWNPSILRTSGSKSG
jgi:hypothetical protein